MRVLNTGDMVDLIDDHNDRIDVMYDSVTGELDRSVMIDLNEEVAEDEQFVFARGYFDEGEYEKSARLLEVFIKYFDTSKYLAEALYYLGQSYEAFATRSENDSLPGLVMNEQLKQRYYSGDVYRIVIEDHPQSPFAAKAQYRLINIYRIGNLPWHDSVDVIQQELAMWRAFCEQYMNTEEYVLGRSEMGYLNRVLFEITGNEDYKTEAISIFKSIIVDNPNTVNAAYANVHIYELEKGQKIYKY